MAGIYKDPKRRVSEPTEADFIRGFAENNTRNSKKGGLYAIAAAFLVNRAMKPRK